MRYILLASLWSLIQISCRSSISQDLNQQKRLCETEFPVSYMLKINDGNRSIPLHQAPINSSTNIIIKTLSGPEPLLTTKSCLALADQSPGKYLLTDSKNLLYGFVDTENPDSFTLKQWLDSDVENTCYADLFSSGKIPLPLNISRNTDLRALSIDIYQNKSGGNELKNIFTKPLGSLFSEATLTFNSTASYELQLSILSPFGKQIKFANNCHVNIAIDEPSIINQEDIDSQDTLRAEAGSYLPIVSSKFASIRYCASPSKKDLCTDLNLTGPIKIDQAGTFNISYQAVDPSGRTSPIYHKSLTLVKEQPKLTLSWTNERHNNISFSMNEPSTNFEASFTFHQDPDIAASIGEKFECRLSYKPSSTLIYSASFAYCDTEICRGQNLGKFISCLSPFKFHIEPKSTFTPNEISWNDLDLGVLQLEVRASDALGNHEERQTLLNYQRRNFPTWKKATIENETIEDSVYDEGTIYISTDKHIYSYHNYKFKLIETPENYSQFGKIRIFDKKLWVETKTGLIRQKEYLVWEDIDLPGLDPLNKSLGDIRDIRRDERVQGFWIVYKTANDPTDQVKLLKDDNTWQNFPCSFSEFITPENETIRNFEAIHLEAESILVIAKEGWLQYKNQQCTINFFPLHQDRLVTDRQHSIYHGAHNKLWAFRPNYLEEWNGDEWQTISATDLGFRSIDTLRAKLIEKDRDGKYWIGTQGDQLLSFSENQVVDYNPQTMFGSSKNDYRSNIGLYFNESTGHPILVNTQDIIEQDSADLFYSKGWQHHFFKYGIRNLKVTPDARLLVTGASRFMDFSSEELMEPLLKFDIGGFSVSALDSSIQKTQVIVGNDISSQESYSEQRIYQVSETGRYSLDEYSRFLPKSGPQAFNLILKDIRNNLWIGVKGKNLFSVNDQGLLAIKNPQQEPIKPLRFVETSKGEFYVLDQSGIIYKLDSASNLFHAIDLPFNTLINDLAFSLDSLIAISVQDERQDLWQFKNGTWQLLNQPWDLHTNQIYQFIQDEHAKLCVVGEWQNIACRQEDSWLTILTEQWNAIFTGMMPQRWERPYITYKPIFGLLGNRLVVVPNSFKGRSEGNNLFIKNL